VSRTSKVDLSEKRVELLRIWYAIFVTIIDLPGEPAADIEKLRKLRERIRKDAPELEPQP